MIYVSTEDYREGARRRLPPFLFEYIDGGSFSEATLKANTRDLAEISLRQRVMRDVSSLDLRTELFGEQMSLPVILGPVGISGMNARRGEVQAARAAEAKGIPFTLSTVSLCPLEEVAKASEKPIWFQLYMIKDRGFVDEMLARAEAVACQTLIFTVDMPLPGSRYRDYRSGLAGASGFGGDLWRFWQAAWHPDWAVDVGLLGRPHNLGNLAGVLGKDSGLDDFFAWMNSNFDPSVTWDDLAYIREKWRGNLIIKGILDAEDALEVAKLGADGLIVSNHGGRQLDGALSTAKALPPIAEAVGDKLTVMADGGVRSGLDVVRMMALGAKGVLLGRAWVYALGARGQAGIEHLLGQFENEMRVAMALAGVTKTSDIGPHLLAVT